MADIPFANIPSTLLTPLFYAEVNNSAANTATLVKRGLIIGQSLSGSQAAINTPFVAVANDGTFQAGAGSQIDLMIRAWRRTDPVGELWILPLADDGAAVAAVGGYVFTGTATAAGSIFAYIAGQLVTVPVTVGMTAAQAATALYNAVNLVTTLPVVATNGTAGTTTITAKNAGLAGNDIPLQLNLATYRAGQATPAGLAIAVTAMASGATNPVLTTALANCQEHPFDFIASPYTDSTSLAAIASFLNDATGRWSWDQQVYGHHFAAYRQTFGGQTTFGATVNDQHLTVMGLPNTTPQTAMEWAASIAAADSVSANADPAQPMQTVVLQGMAAPQLGARFSLAQRETLLHTGISTFSVDQAGVVSISRLITTYQKNSFSQPDNSYLAVETMTTLTEVLRRMAVAVTSKFARMKLAANGTRFAPGSNMVTPNIIRAFVIAMYRELEFEGLVQGSTTFAANLVVQQNATNPNRVDVLWPAILVNQLNIFALLAQFRLSANDNLPTDASAAVA
jgi:phage tail sheath gpL-like